MKNYKTDDSRLVYIFFDAREKWKQRALSYQEKNILMKTTIRDLTFSRDLWKQKSIDSKARLKEKEAEIRRLKQVILTKEQELQTKEQELQTKEQELQAKEQELQTKEQELQTKEQELQTKEQELQAKEQEQSINNKKEIVDLTIYNDTDFPEIITLKPDQYTYPVFVIQLAIQQRLVSFTSWRGIEKTFKLWTQFFDLPTPTFMTIRQWFLKLGLFELEQPKERRSDWIFIVDSTWGQGQNKCFVILGLPYEKWIEKVNNHENLEHQDITVLALEILDISNGDIVASKISNLAEKVGKPLQIISDHGPDIKKGIELYLNDNPEVIYTYDFTHQIALWLKHSLNNNELFKQFSLTADLTRIQIQQTSLAFLIPPKPRYKARYHNIDILVKWGLKVLKYWNNQNFSRISSQFATGKDKFLSGFSWLLKYQNLLSIYDDMLSVFKAAKNLLNKQGLHRNSLRDWLILSQKFPDISWTNSCIEKVNNYLINETKKIPKYKVFPALSDIIESLFSKYKTLSSTAPYSEINEMVLSLFLFTTKLTPDKILEAMHSIDTNTLNNWVKSVFGQSIMAKRKEAFSKEVEGAQFS